MKKLIQITGVFVLAAAMLTGCGAQSAESSSADSVTAPAAALYSDSRAVPESPKWVTELDAAKEAEQLIVVAGYDKNTAYISMHEKQDGKWMKLLSTPRLYRAGRTGQGEYRGGAHTGRHIYDRQGIRHRR